jgi:hypothetical protein
MSDTTQGTIHDVCAGTLRRVWHEITLNTRAPSIITNRVKNRIDDAVWLGVVDLTLENLPSERPM